MFCIVCMTVLSPFIMLQNSGAEDRAKHALQMILPQHPKNFDASIPGGIRCMHKSQSGLGGRTVISELISFSNRASLKARRFLAFSSHSFLCCLRCFF